MSENKFTGTLRDVLLLLAEDGWDEDTGIRRIETYAEAGILTNNTGLVVELSDGSEFQVTIVRSRS